MPLVHVPRMVFHDPLLSLSARALLVEALVFNGRLCVADVAGRPVETADDVLDAVGDLMRLGYATLDVDYLVLTPVAGWVA